MIAPNSHLRFKITAEQFFPVLHQGGGALSRFDSEKAMKNVLHEFDKRKAPYNNLKFLILVRPYFGNT